MRKNRFHSTFLLALAAAFTIAPATDAAVLAITGGTFVGAPTGPIDSPTELSAFTTGGVSHSGLSGATSLSTVGAGSLAARYWGLNSASGDAGNPDAALGLDPSTGFINIGSSVNFFFGLTIDAGTPGDGNDIFVTEFGGVDAITVEPIDGSGNVIGGFSLAITAADWGNFGGFGQSISRNNGGDIANNQIRGIAFDLTDFTGGAGPLAGVEGVRLSGDTFDPSIVGTTVIPEPGTSILLLSGCVASCLRRRRVPPIADHSLKD